MNEHDFDKLLKFLNDDRDGAAKDYIQIQERLITFFQFQLPLKGRSGARAEEYAAATLDRTVEILADGKPQIREPERPQKFILGVARMILLEGKRDPFIDPIEPDTPVPSSTSGKEIEEKELRSTCLDKCLATLPAEEQQLILEYYKDSKRVKIDLRKAIAEKLGITRNTLGIRIHRILENKLRPCSRKCLESDRV